MIPALRISEIHSHFNDLPHQLNIVAVSIPLIDECIGLVKTGNHRDRHLIVNQLQHVRGLAEKAETLERARIYLESVAPVIRMLNR